MNLLNDLDDLQKDGVIDDSTATAIKNWYEQKTKKSSGIIILGILGSVLVCLGIVLVIAHNWDDLSKVMRTIIGFIPVLAGQSLCVYTLLRQPQSQAWREISPIILFFGTGVAMAVIGQVYHTDAELHTYLLAWMLLVLPVPYLLRSYVTALLFIAGITWYGVMNVSTRSSYPDLYFWLMFFAILPFIWKPLVNRVKILTPLFQWSVCISVLIMLAPTIKEDELMPLAYSSCLAVFYHAGSLLRMKSGSRIPNAFSICAVAGSVLLYLILSYGGFWNSLKYYEPGFSAGAIIAAMLFCLGIILLVFNKDNRAHPVAWLFIPFVAIFFAGLAGADMEYVSSLMVLAIGLYHLFSGIRQDHLGWVNTGLFIIGVLTLVRFFDSSISFVIRGIMFILTGAGFFIANWWVLKKRRKNA